MPYPPARPCALPRARPIALLLLLFLAFRVCGQQAPTSPAPRPASVAGSGQLTATILHATTRQPVPFASVRLLNAAGKVVSGGTCDDRGTFTLSNVPPGEYQLTVSALGFEPATLPRVIVGPGSPPLHLDPITLTPSARQLAEVSVTAVRELIETKVDRIVYNAEKDLTNAGGNATDVLQKTPLLSVDLNGTPQLRGSTNLLVLVNGKPSTLLANNVADALRQIPADQIRRVEVYTSPPARYDAEGSAGVINLVLKADRLQGINGSATSSVSTRGGLLNGNATRRRGPLGLSVDLGSSWFYNVARSQTSRTDFRPSGAVSRLQQAGDFTNLGGGAYAQAGLEYDATPKDLLTLSVRANGDQYRRDQEQATTFRTPEEAD
ncbi:MAG TPA: TonB-dependent receptor, partial [bacterium]|nr:TonB-dependent receptor [bacterium]